MRTLAKDTLEWHAQALFHEIQSSGEEWIVTDENRAILRITPIHTGHRVEEVFAPFLGKVEYFEDINTPTTDEWDEV